jgi:hypothetical protein
MLQAEKIKVFHHMDIGGYYSNLAKTTKYVRGQPTCFKTMQQ